MAKRKKAAPKELALDLARLARKAARERDIALGNPNRSVRFATPTNKYDARGRTYRGEVE